MIETIAVRKPFFFVYFVIFFACNLDDNASSRRNLKIENDLYKTVADIPPPADYKRVSTANGSFAGWLRDIALRKDNHVYLYNGALKPNQSAQFAVLDKPIGKKDLQQCADAVMRLRAEYLFSKQEFDKIIFTDNDGKVYRWTGGNDKKGFEKYLDVVYSWCGSASLEKQMIPVKDLEQMQAGDVFVNGGFPGHAMIVMDIAANNKGKKIFMLAQGYMPAQDIHIVRNPLNEKLSPWYEVNDTNEIITPEYKFFKGQLRKW